MVSRWAFLRLPRQPFGESHASTDILLQGVKRIAEARGLSVQVVARNGRTLLCCWLSVKAIVEANPGYKWQNIYNVCHGHKPSYMGFTWRQIPKGVFAAAFGIAA